MGELDEEMVYESRVGDIIALGTSTWRIREITRDRVIVEPAPGRSARLPFWHGEGIGRPAETGRAKGAFVRAVASALDAPDEDEGDDAEGVCGGVEPGMLARLRADGLDENARRNLIELIGAQRALRALFPTIGRLSSNVARTSRAIGGSCSIRPTGAASTSRGRWR